jgi:hypothetical protein
MWVVFKNLTGWSVVGWVSGLSFTVAVAVTLGGAIVNLPYEYTLARIFYTIGFLIILFRISYCLAFEWPADSYWLSRIIATAIIFSFLGVVWVASAMWVEERQQRQSVLISKSAPSEESKTLMVQTEGQETLEPVKPRAGNDTNANVPTGPAGIFIGPNASHITTRNNKITGYEHGIIDLGKDNEHTEDDIQAPTKK